MTNKFIKIFNTGDAPRGISRGIFELLGYFQEKDKSVQQRKNVNNFLDSVDSPSMGPYFESNKFSHLDWFFFDHSYILGVITFKVLIGGAVLLFFIGLLGILGYSSNLIKLLMCFELLNLALCLIFLILDLYLSTVFGHVVTLLIILITAVETVVLLGAAVIYYNKTLNLNLHQLMRLHG